MRLNQPSPLLTLFAVVLLAFTAPGAFGQVVTQLDAGIDLWETGVGAQTTVTIPQDFFCLSGTVQGNPLTFNLTSAPLLTDRPSETGQTDTIVERLEDAVFDDPANPDPDQDTIGIEVRALSMSSSDTVTVTCPAGTQTWNLEGACLDAATTPPASSITVVRGTHGDGGTFTGTLHVPAKLIFTRGTEIRELSQSVQFDIPTTGEPAPDWAAAPGAGGLQVTDLVTVDANCDGILDGLDPTLPPTTNFHPGWDSSTSTTTPTTVAHSGPDHTHPVEVPDLGGGGGGGDRDCIDSVLADCGCDGTGALSVSVRPDSPHAGLRNMAMASEVLEICRIGLRGVAEGGVDPSLCNQRDLIVRENGEERAFEVISVAPCVLDVGTPAQRAERREALRRQ